LNSFPFSEKKERDAESSSDDGGVIMIGSRFWQTKAVLKHQRGMLTVNVVFSSDQLQAASSPDVVGTGLAGGETGQAKPDWPATADWLQNRLLPKAALRPPTLLGANQSFFPCSS